MTGGAAFDPAFAAAVLPALLAAAWVTWCATLGGAALATVTGLVLALLRRSGLAWVRAPASFFVELLRSTPLLVQLYFLYYTLPGWGVTTTPMVTGVVGLGLHYGAYAAEIFRAGLESVPRGQWEAARALGLGRIGTLAWVVVPQAVKPVVPALGNRFVALLKDTPMLSTITVVELLGRAKIIGAETFRYLEPLTLVGLLFLAMSLLAAEMTRRLEARLGRVHA